MNITQRQQHVETWSPKKGHVWKVKITSILIINRYKILENEIII